MSTPFAFKVIRFINDIHGVFIFIFSIDFADTIKPNEKRYFPLPNGDKMALEEKKNRR